jgi:hypothetical protein
MLAPPPTKTQTTDPKTRLIDVIWSRWFTQAQALINQTTAALGPVAFADLPAAPVEGQLVVITNSTTAVWGAVIAAPGGNRVLGYFNGTNWTVAAK